MVDIFTYILYLTLLFFLFLINYKYQNGLIDFTLKNKLNIKNILSIVIISTIVGLRYNVGNDWAGYIVDYHNHFYYDNYQFKDQSHEYFYFLLNKLCASLNLSYEYLFFMTALISWYFIFKSTPRRLLSFFLLFIFFDEFFFWSMNGVRQFISISIWLFSIRYIINKNLSKYIFFIIIAFLFHKSAIILLIFYFIPYQKIFNYKIWLLCFIMSIIIGSNGKFIDYLKSFTTFAGLYLNDKNAYTHYSESDNFSINKNVTTGLGFYFKIITNLIIFFISNYIVKKNSYYKIYFILFFIGSIIFNLSYNVQIVGRFNLYFLIIKSIVLSIIIYELFKVKKYNIYICLFILLYFILFLSAIYNSSNMSNPFRFSI